MTPCSTAMSGSAVRWPKKRSSSRRTAIAPACRNAIPTRRRELLTDLQRTADDPVKLKTYLLKTSMIEGLRRAAATE